MGGRADGRLEGSSNEERIEPEQRAHGREMNNIDDVSIEHFA